MDKIWQTVAVSHERRRIPKEAFNELRDVILEVLTSLCSLDQEQQEAWVALFENVYAILFAKYNVQGRGWPEINLCLGKMLEFDLKKYINTAAFVLTLYYDNYIKYDVAIKPKILYTIGYGPATKYVNLLKTINIY